ncbi:MAG: chemotaxis protein CheW [Azonexus sp.]|jgi:two-component system chemotaxis sensor kinase CheA|uniref:chemotaxis protein CheW n=1 Tax=Azonexus sp. TaxID=1872668 RepID=UPI002816EA0B|nr:chemotaxis protein CheW [Azonexus sp.]MDR0777771.1 chemotaxis protein CheW [Azonexus sp.]
MPIDMSQFYQVFFDESAEHLATMETLLLELDVANPEAEQLNAIFRAVHSIKGSAGTFGFTDLAETTHILENLLDRIRKHELGLQPEMVDAFLESGDLLHSMLEAHQGRGSVDSEAVQAACARLRQLSDARPAGGGMTAPARRPVPVAAAAAANEVAPAVASSSGRRAFGIEFVPTEVSAHSDGIERLLVELRRQGELEVLNHPDAEDRGVGFWRLRLTTTAAPETFSEAIDFIAENGAWRVAEEAVVESTGDGGDFDFFGDVPGVPGENRGYGFFVALEPPPSNSAESGSADTDADDGPDVAPATEEDEVGYGFFAPLPPLVPPLGEVPAGAEAGEGCGFSVSLPSPPVKTPEHRATAAADSSIRVSVDKVDQLINLLGELVITQSMLQQTAVQMGEAVPECLLGGLGQLERNTHALQEVVMSIRMLPISFVFSRFPRVVRDLSAKLGKQVELKISGETTELDKSLVERIADPLTHLIRNSLDHGIEMPEARLAAGKNPIGTITLKASHQGGNVVIEVGDDGAGLPRDKITAKARERGLVVAESMSDQEVFSLIFEAGLSTAAQVTDVSGRGVGMDVVRRNIQELGGRVEIDSLLGVGTRITVRLPLTLAILDGMSVAVGDQTYILPLSHVVESLQPQPGDVRTLANQGRVIEARGEFLPVVVLHELFGLCSARDDLTQGIMVVVAAGGAKAALFVDALVGQHQVVIKSLEANYRRVPGISGATIMGDGRVALILDAPAIATMVRAKTQTTAGLLQ